MLGCRGLLLKLLNIELSKAGVPGTLEPISPFLPASDRVEEYPRGLDAGLFPVCGRSVAGDDPRVRP